MAVIHLTDQDFEKEVLQSEIPVLVDFWAEWCGPCKMIAPVLDEVANEVEGKVKVGKVNVDEAQSLAGKYNVMSIPTLIIFKQGQIVNQLVGALPKEQILETLNSVI